MSKTFLVTGGNGFIGSAILRMYSSRSHCSPSWTARASIRGDKEGILSPHVEYISVGGINKETDWSEALKDVGVVIHTAAVAHRIRRVASIDDGEYEEVNVEGAINLARQSIRAGVKRFIFLSSIGVNGNQTFETPFSENSEPNPIDAYAISKFRAEIALRDLFRNTNIDLIIIRPPLVYGLEAPGNFAQLLSLVRSRIPLPFGLIKNNKRSYVSIHNLSNFILKLLEFEGSGTYLFLISDGVDLSTKELVKKVACQVNSRSYLLPIPLTMLHIFFLLARKPHLYQKICGNLQVDSTKARALVGWTPSEKVEIDF